MTIWSPLAQSIPRPMSVNLQKLSPAERVLWGYGILEPTDIDLEAIAFATGAEVVYRPLAGCEARLVVRGDRAIISLKPNGNKGRQRFSLAHELAHWIGDRGSGSFLCAKEDLEPKDHSAKIVEARANDFASQLILPNYLVDPMLKGQPATMDTASSLARTFNTSLTAAAIRIIKSTGETACLLCHSQSGLSWFQKSIRFPSDYYLRPNLHPNSEAYSLAVHGLTGISRKKTEPAGYWISHRSISSLTVTTQSVRLPDGRVLSMVEI